MRGNEELRPMLVRDEEKRRRFEQIVDRNYDILFSSIKWLTLISTLAILYSCNKDKEMPQKVIDSLLGLIPAGIVSLIISFLVVTAIAAVVVTRKRP